MIMHGNTIMMKRVIINGTVESCMEIYLGMGYGTPVDEQSRVSRGEERKADEVRTA